MKVRFKKLDKDERFFYLTPTPIIHATTLEKGVHILWVFFVWGFWGFKMEIIK